MVDHWIDEIQKENDRNNHAMYSTITTILDCRAKSRRPQRYEQILDFIDEYGAGNLNYVLTRFVWEILEGADYDLYSETIAVLEHLKYKYVRLAEDYDDYDHLMLVGVLSNIIYETYLRKVTPYEDLRIKENGDI